MEYRDGREQDTHFRGGAAMTRARTTMLREVRPDDHADVDARPYQWGEKPLRDAVDAWMRVRWPDARIVHELIMDRGSIRLDVAAITPDRLIVAELKSWGDTMGRSIHQTGMAFMAAQEVWLITDRRHRADIDMLQHLLPGLGVAHGSRLGPIESPHLAGERAVEIEVCAEAQDTRSHAVAQLSLLWVPELCDEALRHRIKFTKATNHTTLVSDMAERMVANDIRRAVCRQLRAREARWRADPAIPLPKR